MGGFGAIQAAIVSQRNNKALRNQLSHFERMSDQKRSRKGKKLHYKKGSPEYFKQLKHYLERERKKRIMRSAFAGVISILVPLITVWMILF